MRFKLSGREFSFPLSGGKDALIGWMLRHWRERNILFHWVLEHWKVDAIAVSLVLVLGLYIGFAATLRTPIPITPIASSSMEPVVGLGDLALVKNVPVAEIGEGDILVFAVPAEQQRALRYPGRIAHRVVRVEQDPAAGLIFWTKGDAVDVMDPFGTPGRLAQGKVVYTIPFLGHIMLFLLSKPGWVFMASVLFVYLVLWHGPKARKQAEQFFRRSTDPELLEFLRTLEEERKKDREIIGDFAVQIKAHLGAIAGIGTATSELTQVVRQLREENASSKRKRKNKRKKRR
ncbi:MAG: signal peptidase I [bacterium]|nr:signal peptidase I [bacterium]